MPIRIIHYEKMKWFEMALQLSFLVAITICNSLQFSVFLQMWVLLDKLHELQHMQFTVCETIVYIYNSCNSITSM
jgi:hypothetical protein